MSRDHMPAISNTSTIAATPVQIAKTVAAIATPEAVTPEETLVEAVELFARKSRASANTGTIWLGFSATNGTQLRPLVPGESYTISAPVGKKIDLADIFIDVETAGDGIIATYIN